MKRKRRSFTNSKHKEAGAKRSFKKAVLISLFSFMICDLKLPPQEFLSSAAAVMLKLLFSETSAFSPVLSFYLVILFQFRTLVATCN
jgi:trans-2-enoyl-CoA reductase